VKKSINIAKEIQELFLFLIVTKEVEFGEEKYVSYIVKTVGTCIKVDKVRIPSNTNNLSLIRFPIP